MKDFKFGRGYSPNHLENPDILSDDILNAIDEILSKCPTAVFGGSIALNAVGVLNRRISDIDLFFPLDVSHITNGFLSIRGTEQTSDTVTDVNGQEIQRTGMRIGNVKCCCFKVSDEELQHTIFKFRGRTIKIQNVNYAIQAKLSYSKSNPKHQIDLDNINEVLNSVLQESNDIHW